MLPLQSISNLTSYRPEYRCHPLGVTYVLVEILATLDLYSCLAIVEESYLKIKYPRSFRRK